MVHHNVCPLCSSEKISLQFRCRDHFISKEDYSIFKCSACDFVFTQDYPEETEIGKFYESDNYISHSDTSKGFSNKLYHLARNVMLRKKEKLIKKITGLKKGTILDIGSGSGHFAGTMKEAGWLVKGIEINERARNFSISYFGLEITSPAKLSTLETNSFDCITLWHVLEHFYDPYKYAYEIYRLLKPGGICVTALPNCSSYDSKYYGPFWAAYDVPRHLWHFNPTTFRVFSEKAGFTLENLRILPLDVFYISQMSEKYKGSVFPFMKGMSKAIIFACLSVFKREKSSSLIYILRKPVYKTNK
ncbi:MAG: class I SAM-dependent methyltransferase [Bacteroidales bacterium]|jgi:2-polyprenyl-3-methyl-5-hydroxy-6-metoxy-1,4-benzoquinol methylase